MSALGFIIIAYLSSKKTTLSQDHPYLYGY